MSIKNFVFRAAVGASLTMSLAGCSIDNLLNGDDPTEGQIIDPGVMNNYTGGLNLYYSSLRSMTEAMNTASREVAAFTDEASVTNTLYANFDRRRTTSGAKLIDGLISQAYTPLQAARVRAGQAGELLLRHGTAASYPLVGNAYAMQALVVLQMAEMLCSGVPLTEVPFERDLTYTAGLSTAALLERAVVLFDTAYFYGKDSLPIATLARVGKGRALLALGKYAEAAAAVADVPLNAQYAIQFSTQQGATTFWTAQGTTSERNGWWVIHREGGNGMPWLADSARKQDPRVRVSRSADSTSYTNPVRQLKFPSTGTTASLIVANGIYARMIEAEAQLQPPNAPSGPWLETLNAARRTVGLPDTTDPGVDTARVNLLFRERAFWMYLTGQRLGDMRRLIRNYGRHAENVYPTGLYPREMLTLPTYGNEKVMTLPADEQNRNPLYQGCIHQEA